jgi:hypothetical protein
MVPELSTRLTIREMRLEVLYTAARLNALPETRHLAVDFEEAAQKLQLLEEEEERLDRERIETQAMIEIADDAWDDMMVAFQRRLLELSGHDQDDDLYRRYFAELPTGVTNLSYAAEIMISKDLESDLSHEPLEELRAFSDRLALRRGPLEAALHERTRLEVELAKFTNRVSLARTLVLRLRRMLQANLEEIATARDRDATWPLRFFRGANLHLDHVDSDGILQVENGEEHEPGADTIEVRLPPSARSASTSS